MSDFTLSSSTIALTAAVVGMVVLAYLLGRISMRRELESINAPDDENVHKKMWWANWLQGVSTEMVGAVITTILLGAVVGIAQEASLEEQQKEELILQMGSQSNDFAIEAARIVGTKGWLEDGSTHGIDLHEAHLAGADLGNGDLQGAILIHASLERVNLANANLSGANLKETDLEGAHLDDANLSGVIFLTIEQLQQAGTLQGAILPDGTQLSGDASWEAEFEAWAETVALDPDGFIIPGDIVEDDHDE